MRGEHYVLVMLLRQVQGSSPHARGALHMGVTNGFIDGIIPACAGSTRESPPPMLHTGDHPRMRGEHPWATLASRF